MRKIWVLVTIILIPSLCSAQVDNQIGTLESVAARMVHAEYFQMDFTNLQFLDEFPDWQQKVIVPGMMTNSTSQLLTIREHIKWYIRGGTIKILRNNKYLKAMREKNPEPGSKESKEIAKATGGPGGIDRQFIYLFGVDNAEAAFNKLIEKKLIVDSGENVAGTKIYQWVESPFNNYRKHTAFAAILPDSSELVMATSKLHLVAQIEARLGMRDLAIDHPEYWEELKPLEKYIDPKTKWGVSFGQDVEKELARQKKVLNLSEAELEERANKMRFMIPMTEAFVTASLNKDRLVKRSISIWNLSPEETLKHSARYEENKFAGLNNWGKDPAAFENKIVVRTDGSTLIIETIFDSEYAAWAYGIKALNHLDEKYNKLKEERQRQKEQGK